MTTIGIDLGTTSCRVGIWRGTHVDILSNDDGSKSTPSFVSFSGAEVVVGEAAKNRAYRNAKNTIFNVKRLVGIDADAARRANSQVPYQVQSYDGSTHVLAEYRGQATYFLPEQIISALLNQLREIACSRLGENISNAVITAPSFFTLFQRKAIERAGKNAGLTVLNVITEPVAAGINYVHKKCKSKANPSDEEPAREVLVLDLGGGTFDAALLNVENGIIVVRATSGTSEVGGEDFDARLVAHCVQDFQRRYRRDIRGNERALRRLCNACEVAKRNLSIASQAYIDIDTLADDLDYSVSVTQHQFEALCEDLFHLIIPVIEETLERGNMSKDKVDDIIMVGGSSRIPRIISLVTDFFGKDIDKGIHADEAVIYGASCTAAIQQGDVSPLLSDTLVLAAIPTSLGVEVQGGVILPVVKRYTTIPTKKIESLTTTIEYQSTALIKIYEVDGKDSKLAGVIQMANLPSNPRGMVIIEVTFDVDAKLSVTVTATEKQSGQSLSTELAFDESVKFPSFDDPYTSTWAVTRHEEQPIPPGTGGPNVANPMPQPPHMGGRPSFNFNQPANPHSNTFNFSQPNANPFNFSSSSGYGPSGGQYPPQGGEAYPHEQPGMFGPPPTTMPAPKPYANPPPRPPVPPKPPTAVIEERLVLMEEKYRLLEAKHEALEAKVRVLEMTLNTRR